MNALLVYTYICNIRMCIAVEMDENKTGEKGKSQLRAVTSRGKAGGRSIAVLAPKVVTVYIYIHIYTYIYIMFNTKESDDDVESLSSLQSTSIFRGIRGKPKEEPKRRGIGTGKGGGGRKGDKRKTIYYYLLFGVHV